MNITVIFPAKDELRKELARQVAVLHVEQTTKRVSQLSCSTEQKQHLIDTTIRIIASKEFID